MHINIKQCSLFEFSFISQLIRFSKNANKMLLLYAVVALLFSHSLPTSATEDLKTALKDHVPGGELTQDDTLSIHEGFIIRNRMTWAEAQTACEKYCSSLLYLEKMYNAKRTARRLKDLMEEHGNVPEDYFTAENKYEFGLDRRYWIGLNNLEQEGTWTWTGTNQPLTYDFWYSETPHHYAVGLSENQIEIPTFNYTEQCATYAFPQFRENNFYEFFTFHEEPCSNKHYAICNVPNMKDFSRNTCILFNRNTRL